MRPNYIIRERYDWSIKQWVVRFFVGSELEEAVDSSLDKARLIAERVINEHAAEIYRKCKG